jgi:hypothetical protein
MNTRIAFIGLLAGFGIFLFLDRSLVAQEPSPQQIPPGHHTSRSVANVRWTVQNAGWLNSRPSKEVAAFIYNVISRGPNTLTKDLFSVVDAKSFRVGDFTFSDLSGNGKLELVASIDTEGRPFFNTVAIIGQAGEEFPYDTIQSWGPVHDFSKEIVDLSHTGTKAIIAKVVEDYPEPEPRLEDAHLESGMSILSDPAWINIYEWHSGVVAQANQRYASYYKTVYVPRTEQTVERISLFPNATLEEKDALASNYKVNLYRAQHLLGEPTAGFQDA